MKHRLVFGTILTAVSNGWIVLTSLLLTPFLIHNLGKEAYGIWVLMTSFTVAAGLLSLLDLGVRTSIVKFVAEHQAKQEKEQTNQVISAGLYLFLGIGLIGAIGTVLFAWLFFAQIFSVPDYLTDEARLLLSILAIQTLFEFPGMVFLAVLEGLQQYVLLRVLIILQMIFYAGLVIILVHLGYGLFSIGIATFVASVGKSLIAMVFTRHLLPGFRLVRQFDRALLHHVIGFSGSMFLVRILAVIYEQMDKIIISIFLTSTLLTDYDIAHKIRMLAFLSLTLISQLMVAPASALYAIRDQVRIQNLFLRGTKYSLALVLPVSLSAIILAYPIIQVWIGPEYTYNTGIAQLFVFYPILTAFLSVGQNIIFGTGHVWTITGLMAIRVGINLVVSIILVSFIGVAGVILGTILGTSLTFVPYLWYFLKTLDISLSRFLREVVFPTYPVALAFALILFLGYRIVQPDTLWSLALLGIAGMGIYGGLFMLFGLSTGERNDLFNTIRRR